MRIEDVKVWQWMLIGLVAGAVVGYTRDQRSLRIPMVEPIGFEKALLGDKAGRDHPMQQQNPAFRNMVLYPSSEDRAVLLFEWLWQNEQAEWVL